MSQDILWDLARNTMKKALDLGADEATVSVGRDTEISLTRRAGKLEQATQSTSQSLSLSLLVQDRFSVHSTSDLRPDSLDHFLQNAIAATRALEPEPERRLVDGSLCGSSISEKELDTCDASWADFTVEARRKGLEALEATVEALPGRDQILSTTCYHNDSEGQSVRVMSNGFEGSHHGTGFGQGVEMTLLEPGGRRPEAMSWYGACYRSMLPDASFLTNEAWDRAQRRLKSGPVASGRYPMLLENYAVGRILGVLRGPLSGAELHQGRSCLVGMQGKSVGSEVLDIVDDPFLPRSSGSHGSDGDGLFAKRMPIFEKGVLQNYYISVYYGRKLGLPHTTGGDPTGC